MSAEAAHMSIRRWREHPADMVEELFGVMRHTRWLAAGAPLDVPHMDWWQEDILEAFPHRPKQVMLACKGPGKTAVLAWLCWNFLLTRVNAKIGATSISGGNLSAGLWSEMAKWRLESKLISSLFTWTATRIYCNESQANWFMDFRTWQASADENSLGQTLAGLWADNVMNVIDEAGGVPVAVLRTAEVVAAQFGKLNCDGHVVLAGNTTSKAGALYHAAIKHRASWDVYEITADPDDPKRTSRIPLEHARSEIAEHGRDNPWVKINILAQFPEQGINNFISADEVTAAQRRHLAEPMYSASPLILGVDIARYGDDETVFWFRKGLASFPPWRKKQCETTFGVSHMLRVAREQNAAHIALDMGNTGAAWYDVAVNSMQANNVLGVHFGGSPKDDKRFFNKRAEMLYEACEHIKSGAALPPVPEMVEGLSTMTYGYDLKGRIQVESKDQIKKRIGRSPDVEDAFMATFAFPAMVQSVTASGLPESLSDIIRQSSQRRVDYDPLERFEQEQRRIHG